MKVGHFLGSPSNGSRSSRGIRNTDFRFGVLPAAGPLLVLLNDHLDESTVGLFRLSVFSVGLLFASPNEGGAVDWKNLAPWFCAPNKGGAVDWKNYVP